MIPKVKQPRIDGANVSLILGHFQKCLTQENKKYFFSLYIKIQKSYNVSSCKGFGRCSVPVAHVLP